ncbi:MAG: nitroreductase family protein [archaeon]
MDVLECIKQRHSVRRYEKKEVDWDKIGIILEAARHAPSSGNLQNWKYLVVKEEGIREEIAAASVQQFWMSNAPVHIVVCAEVEKAQRFYGIRGDRLYSIQNCAAAIENMMLAATSIGLASTWVGAFDEEKIKGILGIPDYIRPQAILVVGHAAEEPEAPAKLHLEDLVYIGKWGNRIGDVGITLREWSTSNTVLSMERNIKEGRKLLDKHGKRVLEKIRDKTQAFVDGARKRD